MPIGVVVSLLWTLPTISGTIVLPGVHRLIANVLIGNVQTAVTITCLTLFVVPVGLMLTNVTVVLCVLVRSVGRRLIRLIGSAVSHIGILLIGTQVLDHDLTVVVVHTATVLGGPLNGEDATLVVVHSGSVGIVDATWTRIATLGIVLGVEQAVGILSVLIRFAVTIVGTSLRVDDDRTKNYNIGVVSVFCCWQTCCLAVDWGVAHRSFFSWWKKKVVQPVTVTKLSAKNNQRIINTMTYLGLCM